MSDEVDTLAIMDSLLYQNKNIYLPRVNNLNEIDFLQVKEFTDLEEGYMGISEPTVTCPRIDPNDLDVLIVPAVAMDRQGNRLGFGKGFYDRFLKRFPNVKTICLIYEL